MGLLPSAHTTSPGTVRAGAVLQAPREVDNVGAYLSIAEALTLHLTYTESVLILTKSIVKFCVRLLR